MRVLHELILVQGHKLCGMRDAMRVLLTAKVRLILGMLLKAPRRKGPEPKFVMTHRQVEFRAMNT